MSKVIIPEGVKAKNVERQPGIIEKLYASIVGGFRVTTRHIFEEKVTIRYPEERKELPKNYRGRHYLDIEKCVACEFCASACPVDIIFIVGEPHPEKVRHPRVFNIDILKCIFCGYCVEACPTGALDMLDVYEVYSPERFILTIDELTKKPEFQEEIG
ncbi:MAG: NuoI/complex I 23 kDa subunit family protein [Candidatus Calescibacterium sp.]|jgi:NADH-quinone oxidoreductase subunit I